MTTHPLIRSYLLNRIIFILIPIFISVGLRAQTVPNFSVNDCFGINYNLFNSLDEGKIVVIGWTMPCGTCVLPLKTTYNVVQSFQASHPGKVIMLLADDYANTDCASINLWANSNGMTQTLRFSNAAIKMMDYGSNGMPKVVVIAGPNRKVFYNANDEVNHILLQQAIVDALSLVMSTKENTDGNIIMKIYGNPVSNSAWVSFSLDHASQVETQIINEAGQELSSVFHGHYIAGTHQIKLPVDGLKNGLYFLKLKYSKGNIVQKFSIFN